ncbi:MAG: peptidoglycan-associated lipoprotein Pal [Hyphomicrobiaceae bacterium]
MRTMSRSHAAVRLFAVVAIGLATMACARGNKGPEARLGNSLNDQGYNDRGRPGARGNHAPGSAGEFQSNGSDTVYFSSDSSDLTPEAQQALQVQAQWLQRYANHTVTIEGHADERGTREYNIALGARRAETVRRFLVSNGVNAARVRATSFGKERPVAVCNDISCWSQNRRAQTVLGGNAVSRN